MKTYIAKYTAEEEQALARAIELGYKTKVKDLTQLVDGQLPDEQASDDTGLLWEEQIVYGDTVDIIVSREFVLDEVTGEKIPMMRKKDIRIPNPETVDVFMAAKVAEVIAIFLGAGEAKRIKAAAEEEIRVIREGADATIKATNEAITASVEVTVE